MSAQRRFEAIISKKEEVRSGVWELTINSNEPYPFSPGQYLWLINPLKKEFGSKDRNAYSISSDSRAYQEVKILVRENDSDFCKWVLSLGAGSVVEISDPRGSAFVLPKAISHPIAIVTEGIGISPFLSFLRSTEKGVGRNVFIAHKDVVFEDEITRLASRSGARVKKLSDEFKWTDLDGHQDKDGVRFYVSGSKEFVEDVYHELVSYAVKDENISFESIYPEDYGKS